MRTQIRKAHTQIQYTSILLRILLLVFDLQTWRTDRYRNVSVAIPCFIIHWWCKTRIGCGRRRGYLLVTRFHRRASGITSHLSVASSHIPWHGCWRHMTHIRPRYLACSRRNGQYVMFTHWQTITKTSKKSSRVTKSLHITKTLVALYSPPHAVSGEFYLTFLAPLLPKLAYLFMLFLLI